MPGSARSPPTSREDRRTVEVEAARTTGVDFDGDGGKMGKETTIWGKMVNLSTKPTPYHAVPVAFIWAIATGSCYGSSIFVFRMVSCKVYYRLHPSLHVNPSVGFPEFAFMDLHITKSQPELDPLCAINDVESFTDSMVAVQAVVQGLLTILAVSIISDLVSRWGRKYTALVVLTLQVIEVGCIVLLILSKGTIAIVLFVLSNMAGSATGVTGIVLALNNYIVDLVQPEQRAPFFGYILAGVYLGMGFGTSFGGESKTYFNNFSAPFWLSLLFSSFGIVYVLVLFPESLTRERRENLIIVSEIVDGELQPGESNIVLPGQSPISVDSGSSTSAADLQTTTAGPGKGKDEKESSSIFTLVGIISHLVRRLNFFGRLEILLPNRKSDRMLRAARRAKAKAKAKRRNVDAEDGSEVGGDGLVGKADAPADAGVEDARGGWNITICAIAFTFEKTGAIFVAPLLVLMLTSVEFGWDQKDIGLILGFLTFIRAFHLFFLHPWVIRVGRAWIDRRNAEALAPISSVSNDERQPLLSEVCEPVAHPNVDSSNLNSIKVKESKPQTNIFDIYWASASFFLCATGIVGLAITNSLVGVYIYVAMIALSGGGIAALQAFASEILEFSMTDSVLAAFSILEVFSVVASPLILGSISAATAKYAPRAAFWVSAVMVTMAGLLFLFVRDTSRGRRRV